MYGLARCSALDVECHNAPSILLTERIAQRYSAQFRRVKQGEDQSLKPTRAMSDVGFLQIRTLFGF